MTAALTDMTGLLAKWGLPADARLAAAEHGTNKFAAHGGELAGLLAGLCSRGNA